MIHNGETDSASGGRPTAGGISQSRLVDDVNAFYMRLVEEAGVLPIAPRDESEPLGARNPPTGDAPRLNEAGPQRCLVDRRQHRRVDHCSSFSFETTPDVKDWRGSNPDGQEHTSLFTPVAAYFE